MLLKNEKRFIVHVNVGRQRQQKVHDYNFGLVIILRMKTVLN